ERGRGSGSERGGAARRADVRVLAAGVSAAACVRVRAGRGWALVRVGLVVATGSREGVCFAAGRAAGVTA
ncbi:MAG: hypothetical protein ACOY0T_03605, partial [Myxococcota bacterium]